MKSIGEISYLMVTKSPALRWPTWDGSTDAIKVGFEAGALAVLLHALEALDAAGVTPAEALAGLRAGKTLEEMCVKRERFGWQTGDKVERITAGEPSRATLGARDDGYDRFELLPRVGNEPHWADGWWLNANYKRIEPEPAVLIIDSAAEADRKIAAMEAEPMSSK